MPYARLHDLRLHYESHGHGPPLLMIHGLGSSGADWAFQVAELSGRFRVITPDLRGSGLSDKPHGPYRIEQFANDLWALLDQLDAADAHLVGFSLGGAVALEMALQRPTGAGRVVLINSLPSYRIDHWRKWLELRLQNSLVKLLGLPRTARLVAKRIFPHPHQAPMRARVAEVVGGNPRHAYLASANALVRWCARDRLLDLQRPTLVLSGELDYTPLQEKRDYARQMRAEFAVIRGSRHGTPFDAIRACNACLAAFLQGAALPDAGLLAIDLPDEAPRTAPS